MAYLRAGMGVSIWNGSGEYRWEIEDDGKVVWTDEKGRKNLELAKMDGSLDDIVRRGDFVYIKRAGKNDFVHAYDPDVPLACEPDRPCAFQVWTEGGGEVELDKPVTLEVIRGSSRWVRKEGNAKTVRLTATHRDATPLLFRSKK